MAVEDRFAGVEISDNDVDRIEVVVDLIRHIETWDIFGAHVARVVKPAKQQESCREESSVFFEARGRPDA